MNSISLTTFTKMKFNLDIGFPIKFTVVEVRQCIVHWVSHFIERPQTSRQGEGHCCWLSYVLASSSTPPQSPTSWSSTSLLLKSAQIPSLPKRLWVRNETRVQIDARMSSQDEGHCHSQYWFRVYSAKSTVGFCKKSHHSFFCEIIYIWKCELLRIFVI